MQIADSTKNAYTGEERKQQQEHTSIIAMVGEVWRMKYDYVLLGEVKEFCYLGSLIAQYPVETSVYIYIINLTQ